jgi:hypothetical protein
VSSSVWKEVAPRLYLATDRLPHDTGSTGKWHVIVNCTVNLKFPPGGGYKRIRIPVDDTATQGIDLYTFLKKTTCLEDMHSALEGGKRVLVYCDVSAQRSAAVLACYFIVYEGMSPAEAVAFVRGQQPDAFAEEDTGELKVTFQSTLDAIYDDERRRKKEKPEDPVTSTSSGGAKVLNPFEQLFSSLVHPKIIVT